MSNAKITKKTLRKVGACTGGIEWFAQNFPQGGEYIDVQMALQLDGKRGYSNWLSWKCSELIDDCGDAIRAEVGFSDALIALLIAECNADSGDASSLAASGDASSLAASGSGSRLAASGYSSRLAASGYASSLAASGSGSRLAASGYSSRLAASGYASRLAASGSGSSLAASGDASRLAASGDASRLAASGYASVIACSGLKSKFTLGENGCAAIAYHDGARVRFAVAYVGENVEANVLYSVNESGEFVEVK